jgi:hypothetical protein
LIIFLTLFLWAGLVQAELSVRLNRDQISLGETVQLQVEAQGQVSGSPDTGPLEQDFEVLGIASGSRVNIINGRMEARSTWTITLSPKRSGTLTIPVLQVAGEQSRTLTLEVHEVPVVEGQAAGLPIFIETELEPQDPYLQGMASYTLRLFYAVKLLEGSLSEPKLDNALVRRLGKDREYSTTRGGRRYQVIERRYAIFPQTSGELELPAPVLDARVPDPNAQRRNPFQDFFGRDPFDDPFFGGSRLSDIFTATQPVRVRGESQLLQVRPRPEQAKGHAWLPAQRVALSESWEPQQTEVLRVGDPLTRNIVLRARGVTGEQLPALEPAPVAGLKLYPDRPKVTTEELAQGVEGEKRRSIAYVPLSAGQYVLPAIRLHWWDTRSDQERVAELPQRHIEVLPALKGQGVPASPDTLTEQAPGHISLPTQPLPTAERRHPLSPGAERAAEPGRFPVAIWPWLSLLFALLWLITLALWWRGNREAKRMSQLSQTGVERVEEARAAKARARYLAACRSNDARAARRHLLAWAAAHWPDDPPRGLDALAQRLPDSRIREPLRELDRILYRGEIQSWDGNTLAQRLSKLPRLVPDPLDKTPLPDLYP